MSNHIVIVVRKWLEGDKMSIEATILIAIMIYLIINILSVSTFTSILDCEWAEPIFLSTWREDTPLNMFGCIFFTIIANLSYGIFAIVLWLSVVLVHLWYGIKWLFTVGREIR